MELEPAVVAVGLSGEELLDLHAECPVGLRFEDEEVQVLDVGNDLRGHLLLDVLLAAMGEFKSLSNAESKGEEGTYR